MFLNIGIKGVATITDRRPDTSSSLLALCLCEAFLTDDLTPNMCGVVQTRGEAEEVWRLPANYWRFTGYAQN